MAATRVSFRSLLGYSKLNRKLGIRKPVIGGRKRTKVISPKIRRLSTKIRKVRYA